MYCGVGVLEGGRGVEGYVAMGGVGVEGTRDKHKVLGEGGCWKGRRGIGGMLEGARDIVVSVCVGIGKGRDSDICTGQVQSMPSRCVCVYMYSCTVYACV